MNGLVAWLCAALGALLVLASSVAGGALVSPQASASAGADDTDRALGMTRVVAFLGFGAGAAGIARGLHPSTAGRTLTVAVAMVVLVVLDAAVREAAANSAAAARVSQGFARAVSLLLRPLVRTGLPLERLLTRTGAPADTVDERERAARRLRSALGHGMEDDPHETGPMYRAFELADTSVREVMVPRVDIIGVEVESPWSEVVDRARSSAHARLPVYHETLDQITGVLYSKDLLKWVLEDREPDAGWTSLARPASFIPGSKTLDRQLREFRKTGTHIAIVADEFGGTAGLVTIEDVLEEIVGDIRDERDVEEPDIEQEGSDKFWVRGLVSLADLSESLGESLERDDVTTVGGLVYDSFDRVPRAGDATTIGNFRVVVERVQRRRVERVYFERLPVSRESAEEGGA